MILCDEQSFLMLLPWKTASQTLVARLSTYDKSPYSKFFYFNKYLGRVVHQHATLSDIRAMPEGGLGYAMASFVRNPYDRVFSGFMQLQHDVKTQRDALFDTSWIRDLVLSQLEENERQLALSGYDVDEWFALVREDQIFEAGRNTNFPLHPAHYWTHCNGEMALSFIGFVENFEDDFVRFTSQFGIPSTPPTNANVRNMSGLPLNESRGYRYTNRLSKKTIDKINTLFSDDFELLGYEKFLI